ncbi:MAG: hypothetical protein AAF346_15215 [Pseudomonadota bacterium]
MTAEIAILNKGAVALATDSAVTISAERQAQKIFDSADKLFELSTAQPIGIMIYNGLQFLGMPLDAVIKEFRRSNETFPTVDEAAGKFLSHLYDLLDTAPTSEIEQNISGVIIPVINQINEEIQKKLFENLAKAEKQNPVQHQPDLDQAFDAAAKNVLERFEKSVTRFGKASFLPRKVEKGVRARDRSFVSELVSEFSMQVSNEHQKRIKKICESVLSSGYLSPSKTGLVFAGFGEKERFPSLVSFEIDGVFGGKIKFKRTASCDIDRSGTRAYVRPFAQQDMVDRFLYGLDDQVRSGIEKYSKNMIGKIADGIISQLEIENEDHRRELIESAREAEKVFLRNLNDEAFKSIRSASRAEIEDMVEFMPKPELAKMAEALIDLTSIKRKVTRGLETVGGPVDVAVISKGEGFVWVKRKHYFPSEINARYFERMKPSSTGATGENR